MPAFPSPNLYAVLCRLADLDAEIIAAREALKARETLRARVKAEAIRVMRDRPVGTVAHGKGDTYWQWDGNDLVQVPGVNSLETAASLPDNEADDTPEPVAWRDGGPIANGPIPMRHSRNCHCPICNEVRDNVSPFVDRPTAGRFV